MAQVPLTIDSLGDLDAGMARAVINRSINDALRDAEDRGHDGKQRKVVLTVSFEKLNDKQVAAEITCQVKLPALKPKATIGNVIFEQGEPKVVFQSHAPDDPNQRTFPQLDEKESE